MPDTEGVTLAEAAEAARECHLQRQSYAWNGADVLRWHAEAQTGEAEAFRAGQRDLQERAAGIFSAEAARQFDLMGECIHGSDADDHARKGRRATSTFDTIRALPITNPEKSDA